MDKFTREIFKHLVPNFVKLSKFGFTEQDERYLYRTSIVGNQFQLLVSVSLSGEIEASVTDLDTLEAYTLFLVESAVGGFVGTVRDEYVSVLKQIAEKCFDRQIFKNNKSIECIDYISEKYGDKLEFLWDRYPDCAICRRKDNRKWYALFMIIPASKLGLDSSEYVEILDVRADAQKIGTDFKLTFPAYHMNKKNWITVLMNEAVDTRNLYDLIDESYALAQKK